MIRLLLSVLCALALGALNPARAQTCSAGTCVAAGPRLVSVDSTQGALLGTLLQTLLPGTEVRLSVLDWNALAAGDVQLGVLAEQLRADLTLSSPSAALGSALTLGQLVTALAQVAQADGQTAQVTALGSLRTSLAGLTGTVRLADLLSVQFPQGALSDIRLDVLDLITGAAQLYNHRNVATTPLPVRVDTAAVGLAGVTALQVYAQVVEPPVYVCGRAGASFHTAAIRLKLDLTLASGLNTAALSSTVSSILGGLALNASNVRVEQVDAVRLSVYLEVAKAEGSVAGIDLLASAVTLQARPGLVNAYLGQIDDQVFFNRSHLLTAQDVAPATATTVNVRFRLNSALGTPIAELTLALAARVRAVASGSPGLQTLSFSGPFAQTRTVASGTVSAGALATSLLSSLNVSLSTSSVSSVLLGALPLPLPIGTITDALRAGLLSPVTAQLSGLLGPVLGALLGGVVDPLLNLLGVQIGQATFSVLGVTRACPVSGAVYRDLQPNGALDPGEGWNAAPAVLANLVQGGQVLQSVSVAAGSGAYTFTDVPRGTFSVVLATAATATSAQPPAGWLFVAPEAGQVAVAVELTPVQAPTLGLFEGARLRGRLFTDSGAGDGTPNDARQTGLEAPAADVPVTLAAGSVTQSARSGADGRYTLYWPAGWATPAGLSVAGHAVTGVWDGSRTTLATDVQGRGVNPLAAPVGPGADLTRDFGLVEVSTFTADASGRTSSPGRLRLAHQFRPGTLGTLHLTAAGSAGYRYTFARDLNCDGILQGSERQAVTTVQVDRSWPRDPDGRLRACTLEVEVEVPAGTAAGATDAAVLTATLVWAGSAVSDARTVTDTTLVAELGRGELVKRVRNLTRPGAAAGQASDAYPGEQLEYCLDYRNAGGLPLNALRLSDDLPAPLLYVPGTLTRDGAALTDLAGDDDGAVTGRHVEVRLDTLEAGQAGTVCFAARMP